MFRATERLRTQLETERAQYHFSKTRALDAVNADKALLCWRMCEYRKGRVDGIRLALELIAGIMREEVAGEKEKKRNE